jgi:hypothetical protein
MVVFHLRIIEVLAFGTICSDLVQFSPGNFVGGHVTSVYLNVGTRLSHFLIIRSLSPIKFLHMTRTSHMKWIISQFSLLFS